MSVFARAFSTLADQLETLAQHISAATGWRRWLIALFAGVCGALALAPFYLLPMLAVSLTTFVLLIDGAASAPRSRRRAFIAGWFWGFGYFLAGVYWMAFSFFVQADQFAWMAPFAVTGMPAFLALFTAVAAWLCVMYWPSGWARIFALAAIFAVTEFARGHVLTGLPWNLTGQALAGTAIGSQTAAWYGAYGLSLIAVLLGAAPAATLQKDRKQHPLFGFAVMLAGAVLLFAVGAVRLALPEPENDARTIVRIVQPNIPQREKIQPGMWARNFERQMEHSRGAVPPDAQLFIIWPENGAPLLNEAATALEVIEQDLPDNAVLIAGAVRRERNDEGGLRYFNSIAFVEETSAGRRVTKHYDKHHLVPFGEYLPFYTLLDRIGLAQLTPYGDSGFTAGAGPAVVNLGGPAFAPMVCYEAIFPGRSYPRGERPAWLVVVTNDAWFGDTSGPRQHLDMARLRSIEAGLPMARSANTGVSTLIDGKGRMLARVKLYEAGKIEAPLPPALPRTLYDRFGDAIFWAMALICGFFGFRPVFARNR
ncbi:MAG: apolipoprotein N-acyltransferase [Pseudomonadota bacterium]